MEWYHKNLLQWDWENLDLISGKVSEICNSTEQSEWGVGGAVSNGSLFSPDSSTFSGSELLDDSSKNSISTSAGSLVVLRNSISDVNHEEADDVLKSKIESENEGMVLGEVHRNSPAIVESVYTVDPPIGLKLGKRTYFENLSSTNFKITLPASSVKKFRASNMAIQHSRCQVDGCNIDLTGAKDYHRKHRVCASHSKSPRVIVAGYELRFCQQCSRFHDLSEFDQKKRSCRRRLSDHNARRRKLQPKTISFNSSRIPPTSYVSHSAIAAPSTSLSKMDASNIDKEPPRFDPNFPKKNDLVEIFKLKKGHMPLANIHSQPFSSKDLPRTSGAVIKSSHHSSPSKRITRTPALSLKSQEHSLETLDDIRDELRRDDTDIIKLFERVNSLERRNSVQNKRIAEQTNRINEQNKQFLDLQEEVKFLRHQMARATQVAEAFTPKATSEDSYHERVRKDVHQFHTLGAKANRVIADLHSIQVQMTELIANIGQPKEN